MFRYGSDELRLTRWANSGSKTFEGYSALIDACQGFTDVTDYLIEVHALAHRVPHSCSRAARVASSSQRLLSS